MKETLFGIALLISIVAAQFAVSKLRQRKMFRCWNEAQAAMVTGRFEDAERALERCVAIAPLWVHGTLALALVRGRLGKAEEAEAGLLRARELHPTEAEPDYGLGMLYATAFQDRGEEAVAAFRDAVEKNPEFGEALLLDKSLVHLRDNPDFTALLPVERETVSGK